MQCREKVELTNVRITLYICLFSFSQKYQSIAALIQFDYLLILQILLIMSIYYTQN